MITVAIKIIVKKRISSYCLLITCCMCVIIKLFINHCSTFQIMWVICLETINDNLEFGTENGLVLDVCWFIH